MTDHPYDEDDDQGDIDGRVDRDGDRYPRTPYRRYHLDDIDLMSAPSLPDAQPRTGPERQSWARHLMRDAAIYGLPAVMQHLAMVRDLLDDPPVALNSWRHDRRAADADYAPFTTPNADTLYSQAWIDLRSGPVILDIPPMGDRYYTAHLLDAHSNAVNLSTRTVGGDGGRFALCLPEHATTHAQALPVDVTPVTVASPIMWLLGRILVRGHDDLPAVHSLQDQLTLTPLAGESAADLPTLPTGIDPTTRIDELPAHHFLALLDQVLRLQGHPSAETALVQQFTSLGLGIQTSRVETRLPQHTDDAVIRGIEMGYSDAFELIHAVRDQRGVLTPSGWRALHSGTYGFNYVHRAATNYMGLGATTREENASFTALIDINGRPLDGSACDYVIDLEPPEVGAFWSLSAYDLGTRRFVRNSADRYTINDQVTPVTAGPDGSIRILLSPDSPLQGSNNWLPTPAAPFYLVLHAYLGAPAVVSGEWFPAGVRAIPRG